MSCRQKAPCPCVPCYKVHLRLCFLCVHRVTPAQFPRGLDPPCSGSCTRTHTSHVLTIASTKSDLPWSDSRRRVHACGKANTGHLGTHTNTRALSQAEPSRAPPPHPLPPSPIAGLASRRPRAPTSHLPTGGLILPPAAAEAMPSGDNRLQRDHTEASVHSSPGARPTECIGCSHPLITLKGQTCSCYRSNRGLAPRCCLTVYSK